jgi:hypothetical protein
MNAREDAAYALPVAGKIPPSRGNGKVWNIGPVGLALFIVGAYSLL